MSTAGSVQRRRGETAWADVAPPEIEHEDRLPSHVAQEKWNAIFRLFDATNEGAQKEVKLAVYAYYAVNGASVRTLHSRDINTGGGVSVLAADVRECIGETQIRKFLRSDVNEAYSALKETETLERDEVFVKKAMAKGVPRGFAHCAVDFLRGCSLMTPEEEVYAEMHFNNSIRRARAARGGATITEEDERSRDRVLSAQQEVTRVPGVSAQVADDF